MLSKHPSIVVVDDSQASSHEMTSLEKAPGVTTTTVKSSWRSLFAFTKRKHCISLFFGIATATVLGILKPLLSIIYGKLFASLTRFGDGTASGKQTLHSASIWCIALTAIAIASWIAQGGLMLAWIGFGELQAKSVREDMFTAMLDKDMEWYDSRDEGIASFLIRIQTQIRELQLAASQPLGLVIYQFIATTASLGVALYFSWNLSLVIIAIFPIAVVVLWLVSRGITPAIEAQKRELGKATNYANTAITAIDTVKAFNAQDQELWKYLSSTKKMTIYYLKQARANAMQFGLVKFLAVSIFVQGFWYGLYLVDKGLSPASVITTFYSCITAVQAIEVMLPQILVLTRGMSAGATLKNIMQQIQHGAKAMDMGGTLQPETCQGDIEVKDIAFAYPTNPKQLVLDKASFFFPAGETTFVVGKSGSGKSTIGNILMRYYEKQSGQVLIDGIHIEDLSTDWLRKNVTLVQQQGVLFNETIYRNIAFGSRDGTTYQDVELAVKTGCLEETISGMPEGLDTIVGSNGRSLSGGQMQRVAIARSRLRDAPIVILDESTSALDNRGRTEVMDAIRDWRRGKTTIVITHDLSQIRGDEYVYVLANAHVIQEGFKKKPTNKSNGTFASLLITETDSPVTEEPPAYSSGPSIDPSNKRWSHLSNPFSNRPGSITDAGPVNRGPHRISFGAAIAQASDLQRQSIWAGPIIPEISRSRRPSHTLMRPSHTSRRHSDTVIVSSDLPNMAKWMTNSTPLSPVANRSTRILSLTSMDSNGQGQRFSTLLQGAADPTNTENEIPTSDAQARPSRASASMRKILSTVWPVLSIRQRLLLVLGFIGAVIVAAATPAFAYALSELLSTFYATTNQLGLAKQWALVLLGIAFLDGSAAFTTRYALEYCGQCWVNALRLEALKRIFSQPKSWFDMEENSPSRLNQCLDRNGEEMRNLVGRFAGLTVTVFIMLTISIVWAFIVAWQITIVLLACAPVFYLATVVFQLSTKKWEEECNRSAVITSSKFTETFANIRVVRALTLEAYFGKKYKSATRDTYHVGRKRAAYTGLFYGLLDMAILFAMALAYYYGTVLVTNGTRSVTQFLEVFNLMLLGFGNASALVAQIPQISSSCATATQMLHLANLPYNQSTETQGAARISSPFPVKMNNLSFTYPNQPSKTLDGITVEFKPGSCTAVVGHSGSGKSTIIALLQGLYPPDVQTQGPPALTYHGRSILECNITALRTFISTVPQTPILFPTTVLENIVYGLSESSPYLTTMAAERAAKEAGIHDFIVSLPQSYNTVIGDGGQGVSGGQAQRIAIARALVRKPKVLIMDEATSALDMESAEKIKACIKALVIRGVAVVMVTHNIDMMRSADTVVVLHHGQVMEIGGFEELRRRNGTFAKLLGDDRELEGEIINARTVRTGSIDSVSEIESEGDMTPLEVRTRYSWTRR
ncbi:P-loop containing nucleoside triphosphate hydrolase protein [Calycina marina]|uniref:P-loop containing nucleoside triphosphate hydrolase protein n=1 Tax=Calycina marina TaxID=1763456 RepID=A0A9P7ZA40_9HELO|nr:P-loop containing nucleoside triphosphate hydrolase protein [Calycina marina]